MTTDLDNLEDQQLLRRFVDGQVAAFETLLGRYRRPLYNFILRSVRDPASAEDLLQDVFLRVIQSANDFKGESKVSTWMYTIARNLCIDSTRKMAFRRHRSLDAPARGGEADGSPLVERIATDDIGAARATDASQMQQRIARAVEELPDEQREVFLLRQLQNLAFKEIAEIVGVPENTVKSRMRYALERLQEALHEYADYAQELK